MTPTARTAADTAYRGPLTTPTGSRRAATLSVAVGALAVSTSAIFIDLSDASAITSSVWRCLLAAPLVALAARWERPDRAHGARRRMLLATACGLLFAGDMIWWAQAIGEIGAGMSTVLVNAQVVVVPLLAWVVDGERPGRTFALTLPLMAAGVVLAGGVIGGSGAGASATAGTVHGVLAAASYSGFLFLLRRLGPGNAVRGYRDALVVAGVTALVIGVLGGADLTPSTSGIGWLALVAALGQAPGWLLVALASPRLPTASGAALLLLTPVGALVLAVVVLGQAPTALQLIGCALVVVGVLGQAARRRVVTS